MRTLIFSSCVVLAATTALAQAPAPAPDARTAPPVVVRKTVQTTDGRTLEGRVLNEGMADLQLRTDDQKIHLLRKTAGDRYRPVTSQRDWTTYHGDPGGNRYTTLTQIDKSNVARLAPRWVFPIPNVGNVETTPIVVEGIMYISSANEVYALDAGSGRQIWHYQRPRTKGLTGNAAGGFNRGVAISGDRLFLLTDNAHMIAMNRFTGELLWDTEMADWHQNYNGTSAPLVVGNLVISGTAGGDEGVRGFVAAYDTATGKEAWRFWTVPKPGEPGSETWEGKLTEHRGGASWMTGTYDPQLDLVYWPTGNPGLDYNGDERKGDNLYTDSVVALEAKTGKLRWYFQFTPHDIHDWDAQEPPVLVDVELAGPAAQAPDSGQPQRVLLCARSHERSAAPGETVPEESQLGKGHRRERAPDSERPQGGRQRRNLRVPRLPGRHELVLDIVQSGHGPLLFSGARTLQSVHETRHGMAGGPRLHGRRRASGSRRNLHEVAARDQHSNRRRRLGSGAGERTGHRLSRSDLDGLGPGVFR